MESPRLRGRQSNDKGVAGQGQGLKETIEIEKAEIGSQYTRISARQDKAVEADVKGDGEA